jgi:hypothetical protein
MSSNNETTGTIQKAITEGRLITVQALGTMRTASHNIIGGDMLLVDTGHTNPIGGGTYVLEGYAEDTNIFQCESYGSMGILVDGKFITEDEFNAVVTGRIVGTVQGQLLKDKPPSF